MASVSYKFRLEQVRLPSHVIDLAADELRSAQGEQIESLANSLTAKPPWDHRDGFLIC
jgi:hypothetical protein